MAYKSESKVRRRSRPFLGNGTAVLLIYLFSLASHGCTSVCSSFAGSEWTTWVCKEKQGGRIRKEERQHWNGFSRGAQFRARGGDAVAAAEGLCFSETIIPRLTPPGFLVLLLSKIYCHEAGLKKLKIGKHDRIGAFEMMWRLFSADLESNSNQEPRKAVSSAWFDWCNQTKTNMKMKKHITADLQGDLSYKSHLQFRCQKWLHICSVLYYKRDQNLCPHVLV